ncbi:MAG TPA: ATP-binding protein, partial [Thermodesulfobacteriota bacterium]|nr:ATP-binding protein [Thermodesulfobacteriota bacterium]
NVTEKGVSINLETRALEGEGDCFMDRGLITKALSYILENSLEAVVRLPMRKKAETVRISLFGDEGTIGVSVSDKGEGIPKKNMHRLFEPFFSTRPDQVGLGLTFVKRVVEEQGGSIRVESHLKKGTTVTLIFPKDRRRIVRRGEILSEAVWKDRGGHFPNY